jgi:nitroimidazol reductase NimA-like FMN-containing flavoprotein (pyridoxamine 5'-phosphate oxidase superfamily)
LIEVDPIPSDATNEIEVLSADESAKLLASEHLGRIAIVVDGQPEIFPVNYAFDEGVVVLRTTHGRKLDRGPLTNAAFEVDRIDHEQRLAWSVVVKGTVQDITTTLDRLSERLRKLVVHPAAPGQRSDWLAIYSHSITGRRFTLPPVGEHPSLDTPGR